MTLTSSNLCLVNQDTDSKVVSWDLKKKGEKFSMHICSGLEVTYYFHLQSIGWN